MDIGLARKAMDRVQYTWDNYIPKRLKSVPAEQVFLFHASPISFRNAFTVTFDGTFRAACGLPSDKLAVEFQKNCRIDQFVSAEISNLERRVHISPEARTGPKEYDPEAVLAHEYIHWLSHPKFYPLFYKRGGACPSLVEGCTEWMMVYCYYQLTISLSYVDEFQRADAWVRNKPENLDDMAKFVFKGVECNLS